jgi:hypothetical protein
MLDVLLGDVKALDWDLGVISDEVWSAAVSLVLLAALEVEPGSSNLMPMRFFKFSITMDAFLTA